MKLFIASIVAIIGVTSISCTTEDPKTFIPINFVKPIVPVSDDVYFVEYFKDSTQFNKDWFVSTAKKNDGTGEVSAYEGKWEINEPTNVLIKGDKGLIVKDKALHHAVSSKLKKTFDFTEDQLIVQFETMYEEGQDCGGGYIKLLTVGAEKDLKSFNNLTPYSIMFGPDKCGTSAKIHFIINYKNPKNGTISEHHNVKANNLKSIESLFDDKKVHLYSLQVTSGNTYTVSVDGVPAFIGNLLTDLAPAIEPVKEIDDPKDVKPADWDDREMIVDETATKPEDHDDNAPETIVDTSVSMPEDWLESESELIPDPEAQIPADWDTEMDGEFEAKLIPNPKCVGISGCGPWKMAVIPNPAYKGIWKKPKIANPAYKGKFIPKKIDNPDHFEPKGYTELLPFSTVGIELWTMSKQIVFDNFFITSNAALALTFAQQTTDVKKAKLIEYDAIFNPTKSFIEHLTDIYEAYPEYFLGGFVCVLLVAVTAAVFFWGRKTSRPAYDNKKTDAVNPDDEDELEEIVDDIIEDVEDVDADKAENSEKYSAPSSEDESVHSQQETVPTISKEDLEEEPEQVVQEKTHEPEPEPIVEPVKSRKARARRQD